MSEPDATEGNFNPLRLIEEVRKRAGLYSAEQPTDRLERLHLWKEVGAALCPGWDTFNKGAVYQTVLQMQRKWRSLRDSYNRELRARRSGVRLHRRVYIYFKNMSFLGGFEGTLSDDEETTGRTATDGHALAGGDAGYNASAVAGAVAVARPRKKRKRASGTSATSTESEPPPDEAEMPLFNNVELPGDPEADTDRLFLLSFLPEMRQLPLNVKMWARAQIANVMQEAVSCHYGGAPGGCGPGGGGARAAAVKQRRESSE